MWRNASASPPRVYGWLYLRLISFWLYDARRLYLRARRSSFYIPVLGDHFAHLWVCVGGVRSREKQQGNKERAHSRRSNGDGTTFASLQEKVITSFAERTWRVHICGPTRSRGPTEGGNATELLNMYSKNYLGHNGS
jgi:hypothetical protein